MSRLAVHQWMNDNLEVEDLIIRELEAAGLSVIPVFSYSVQDTSRGCKGSDHQGG